jgi:multidrug resistance efflux pump
VNQGNNIALRNDEVRDILQKMPHWTIRWGISILFGIILLLLLFTWFYRYPNIIRSEVVVSASHPPAMLKARATGKITQLLVAGNERVESGQLLAVIENPAETAHVLVLEEYLATIAPFFISFDAEQWKHFNNTLVLGEVQAAYADFTLRLNNYFNFLDQPLFLENIVAANQRLHMLKVYYDRLWSQRILQESDLQVSAKTFRRDSTLHRSGVLADADFDAVTKDFIARQLEFEKIRSQLALTQAGIHELEQEVARLQMEYEEKIKTLKLELLKAREMLENSMANWKMNYLLVSPVDGRVNLDRVWAVNQNVETGTTVMTIVPEGEQRLIGKAYITTRGAGKVKPGQRVNIKLHNYPYMEYGMLIGTVKHMSEVPVNETYAIEIDLPQHLTTNYGRVLDMQQELWGECEIITEDLRLLQRIIYPVKAVIEKNRR